MATNIAPEQFSQIMALPKHLRRDLLEFLGFASISSDELSSIISDLKLQNPVAGKSPEVPATR